MTAGSTNGITPANMQVQIEVPKASAANEAPSQTQPIPPYLANASRNYVAALSGLEAEMQQRFPNMYPAERTRLEIPLAQIFAREASIASGVDFSIQSARQFKERGAADRIKQQRENSGTGFTAKL